MPTTAGEKPRKWLCVKQITPLQTTSEPLPQFVTAGQIASFYKVTPAAVRFWAKSGKIPCLKFESTLRFNLAAVRAKIEGTPAATA
jgi:hypothetical protein